MREISFTAHGVTYKRVSKPVAKRAYVEGRNVVVAASNIRPFNEQEVGYTVITRCNRLQFINDEVGAINDFYNLINSFEYYNCTNTETGKSANFYLAEERRA